MLFVPFVFLQMYCFVLLWYGNCYGITVEILVIFIMIWSYLLSICYFHVSLSCINRVINDKTIVHKFWHNYLSEWEKDEHNLFKNEECIYNIPWECPMRLSLILDKKRDQRHSTRYSCYNMVQTPCLSQGMLDLLVKDRSLLKSKWLLDSWWAPILVYSGPP